MDTPPMTPATFDINSVDDLMQLEAQERMAMVEQAMKANRIPDSFIVGNARFNINSTKAKTVLADMALINRSKAAVDRLTPTVKKDLRTKSISPLMNRLINQAVPVPKEKKQ